MPAQDVAARRRGLDDSDDERSAHRQIRRAQKDDERSRRSQATRALEAASSSSAAGPSRTQTGGASTIDIAADLRPQPLSRSQVPNIRQLLNELKSQDTTLLRCIEQLNDTAEQLAEAFRAYDDCPELEQADLDLRELIDAQAEKAIRRTVLEEMAQDLQGGVTLEDPSKRYRDEVQIKLDKYNKQTARKKYAKNTDYHNFKNALWVAKQEGAMPPVKDLIPAEAGDEDDESDEEFTIGGEMQNFRCPLTTNILEDPLTNSNCKHSYSRSAIDQYVSTGNSTCPASGCPARVSKSVLKQDPNLVRRVAQFKRREEERLIARRNASTVLY